MTCPKGCCDSYREHVASIAVAGSAMPTRRSDHAVATAAREERWNQDIPAYRRLRKAGVQPKQVDGSKSLERQMGG